MTNAGIYDQIKSAFQDLKTAIDIRERLAALEARRPA
jgi:hypothetical protein